MVKLMNIGAIKMSWNGLFNISLMKLMMDMTLLAIQVLRNQLHNPALKWTLRFAARPLALRYKAK